MYGFLTFLTLLGPDSGFSSSPPDPSFPFFARFLAVFSAVVKFRFLYLGRKRSQDASANFGSFASSRLIINSCAHYISDLSHPIVMRVDTHLDAVDGVNIPHTICDNPADLGQRARRAHYGHCISLNENIT